MARSSRSKLYSCPAENCEKVFVSFQGFKEHRKVHGSERYRCQEHGCDKVFKWRSSLASHKKSHQLKLERLGREEALSPVTTCDPWSPVNSMSTNSNCFENSQRKKTNYQPTICVMQDVSRPLIPVDLQLGVFGNDDNDDLYLFPCDNLSPLSTWEV